MTDGAGMNGPFKQTLGGQLSGASWDLSDRDAAEIVSIWLRSDEVADYLSTCADVPLATDPRLIVAVLDALSGLVSEDVERAHQDDWRPEEDGE